MAFLTINEFVELSPPELAAVLQHRHIDELLPFLKLSKKLTKTAYITKINLIIGEACIDMDVIHYLDRNLTLDVSLPIIKFLLDSHNCYYRREYMIWADVRSVDIIHELLAQGVDPDFIRWGNIEPLSRVKELLYVVGAAKNKIQKRLLSPYDKTAYTLLGLDYGDIVVEYNYKRVRDIFTFGVKKIEGVWMVDRYDRSISNLFKI